MVGRSDIFNFWASARTNSQIRESVGLLCNKITGLDPLQSEIYIAKKNKPRNVSFIQSTIEDLQIKDNSIDKIYGICSFQHFSDDQKAFKKMFYGLKKDGLLVATLDSLNHKLISDNYRKRQF